MHGRNGTLGLFDFECEKTCNSEMESTDQASGSLVQSTGVLCSSSACQSKTIPTSAKAYKCEDTSRGLGHCSSSGLGKSNSSVSPAVQQRYLGLCASNQTDSLEDALPGVVVSARFRPAEFVRLLNGTPIGQVISDRQLYRHRQTAPELREDGKFICLFKYCAWLFLERQRKRIPRKRRSVDGREVPNLSELRLILERQNHRCALTGEVLTHNNFDLDHIVPIAEGGDFTAANCQLVTAEVNRAKNTMPEEAFIAMCKRVTAYRSNVIE